jgi:hypothetical protein
MHADVENDRMVWCSAKIFFVNSTQLTWSVEVSIGYFLGIINCA